MPVRSSRDQLYRALSGSLQQDLVNEEHLDWDSWNLPFTYPVRCDGHLRYTGPYPSWRAAVNASVGYDSPVVLEKVRAAVEDVLEGRKAYERDGTTFSHAPGNDTLRDKLTLLMRPGDTVVDFGGGLGSTYIVNRSILEDKLGRYLVIEQPSFCTIGSRLAAGYSLPIEFKSSISEVSLPCVDIVIASAVLHYVRPWKRIVRQLLGLNPRHVILDRHPLVTGPASIVVQENFGYYATEVSYPSRMFNVGQFVRQFKGYRMSDSWPSDFDPTPYRGFHLVRSDLH